MRIVAIGLLAILLLPDLVLIYKITATASHFAMMAVIELVWAAILPLILWLISNLIARGGSGYAPRPAA